MKRLVLILLAALLLCGCAAQPDPEVTAIPTETVPMTAPTAPAGFYDPSSALEAATGGAVRVYPLGTENTYGMAPMGDGFLLFSGSEFTTTLTKVTGDTLHVEAVTTVDCDIYPDDPCTQVSEKGVTYYDSFSMELVFLDTGLKEVKRVALPEEIVGRPALSNDRKTLYYCTSGALRAIDLETNLDRLLKEMFFPYQSITALHRDDTILECFVQPEDGSWYSLFFSVQTGETLWEYLGDITLQTQGDSYFATVYDGAYREILTGSSHYGPSVLNVRYTSSVEPVLALNGALEITESADSSILRLDFYDLGSGSHLYALELPGESYVWNICGDPEENCIWFLRYDSENTTDTICRWELDKSPAQDDNLYLGSRHSLENPDLEGLAQSTATAEALSKKHGVNIRVWEDATAQQPWDYTLQPEYQVPLIDHSLELLDQALAGYPKGFLKKTASGTDSGLLNICLVRSIYGIADTGALDSVSGLQFWDDDGNAYVCVTMDYGMEQALYHELFHMIESRVLSTCSAYDSWEDLNPEGFTYDYDYLANLYREDGGLTEGENQAFIDTYSMSFPKEDRARIMEYAMMPNNEYRFGSEFMQAKLRQLCLGIREAYDLEKSAEIFRWEQYLAEPIHSN